MDMYGATSWISPFGIIDVNDPDWVEKARELRTRWLTVPEIEELGRLRDALRAIANNAPKIGGYGPVDSKLTAARIFRKCLQIAKNSFDGCIRDLLVPRIGYEKVHEIEEAIRCAELLLLSPFELWARSHEKDGGNDVALRFHLRKSQVCTFGYSVADRSQSAIRIIEDALRVPAVVPKAKRASTKKTRDVTPQQLDELLEAIAVVGRHAKPEIIKNHVSMRKQARLAGLRKLFELGSYDGFARQPSNGKGNSVPDGSREP
jgi:hypothetical protein